MTLKPEQWDNLMSKSEILQEKIIEELSILEKIEDPCSTEFYSQLSIVKQKIQMLVDLNSAIKLGLGIQLKPKHNGDPDGDHQLTIEDTEV
jgi:hypothetical protein